MESHFRQLINNFNLYTRVKQPDMTSRGRCYKIYSPQKFKLRPRDDIHLDLKFNIQTPETIQPWLNLLPSLKTMGLYIENNDWADNKTRDPIAYTQQKFYLYCQR